VGHDLSVAGDTLALARRYVDIDRPQAALEALGRAEEDELEEPEYWAIRAQALLQLDRPTECAEAATRGLEQSPEDIELLDLLALAHLQLDDPDGGLQLIDRALQITSDHPILLAHKALLAANAGKFYAARDPLAKALRLAPESPDVLRVRAQVAYLAGDDEAPQYVDDLLAREPEDPVGHALRGNLAVDRKQYVSAKRSFETAAQLDPSNPELVEVAGKARIMGHPVLAPVRPIWRFGRWRSYFLYLTLVFVLAAAQLDTLRYIIIAIWVSLALLSWVAPWVLRLRRRRKFGAF
jgi:tetratricopeptide (TPR) repeat protein